MSTSDEFDTKMDGRTADALSLDAIDRALSAPRIIDVHNLEDLSGAHILRRADLFGANVAIAVGRAEASALRMRECELRDVTLGWGKP